MIELTHEAIESMEGLINFKVGQNLQSAAIKIYKDLEAEGFDREEIIAFLYLMIESSDRG